MQKTKNKKAIIFSLIGISIIGLVLSSGILNTCGVRHVNLISDLQTYEDDMDPEFCDSLVNKILIFNEECDSYIEIVDCG